MEVRRLVQAWNPALTVGFEDEDAYRNGNGEGVEVAEGVRLAGPIRLDPETLALTGLSSEWTTAYAACCVQDRVPVPDGIDADLVRLRYPHGLPVGAEGRAWSLLTGLARRLCGATRLPAGSPRATRSVAVRRIRGQDNTYCVYGNEALSWSVLRSVLSLTLPELDRNGTLAPNDYCLDRPGSFEVRVRPFRADGFVPYALRPRVVVDWPCTVYRFRCLPQATDRDADRIDTRLRDAACQLADVVGGLVLDGDGFPLTSAVPLGASR